jgi:endonuclease/exonuclease/phosphatase family metal-dependent hydrolase
VSVPGTLAVADVEIVETQEIITIASLYGLWEKPVSQTGSNWIYADASVHRLVSDLSALIGRQQGHKLIAAGDLNVLCGYGEYGSPYWKARYDTVFARMEALGLRLVGPQAPGGGAQAMPWPDELPPDSGNVPTYRTRQRRPETGTRQLDFVFASSEIYDRVSARALNAREDWGPSDHCRVLIELQV